MNHLIYTIGLAILLSLLSCNSSKSLQTSFHPMVDGRNTEYERLKIQPIKLSKDVNLYVFQNEDYVWISYDYPIGSYGTLDMILASEKLSAPINLHISVQLGEWYLGADQPKPETPTSEMWWNMNGWTANPLWANGIDTISYDTPEFKIQNGEIREMQLSKDRFGKGEWKMKLKIYSIKGVDGKYYSIDYPEDGSDFVLEVH